MFRRLSLRSTLTALCLTALSLTASAQQTAAPPAVAPQVARTSGDYVDGLAAKLEPTRKLTYKKAGDQGLELSVFEPKGWKKTDSRPCFVTFHGGGWSRGAPRRTFPLSDFFASKGLVGISVQYRLDNPKAGVSIVNCVQDARSALRYIRKNAADLGIDPDRIIVNGGSAGGHLAAGTTILEGPDEPGEDLSVSCAADALVLFYPVIDTSSEGYGASRLGSLWKDMSPLHQVRSGLPPVITFHGSADTTTPFKGAKAFHEAMLAAGNQSELVVGENAPHTYLMRSPEVFEDCLEKTVAFLTPLGFMSVEPTAKKAKRSDAKTVRILTIGNSFSRNATRHLPQLVKAAGHELIHQPIIVGGASLELHAVKAQKHERDAADKEGLYKDGTSLKQALKAQPWDYITIQQASIKSHDLSTYQPYASWLAEYIHKHSPAAKLLMHQTWAYRVDDPRFSVKAPKPGEPKTQEEMYKGLRNAYTSIARELKAGFIPSGDALYLADTNTEWGYKPDAAFDLKTATPPALPNQKHSLHVGYTWAKGKDGKPQIRTDGHHANTAGEYLGACVFFETLYGESPVGNTYFPRGMDPAYAKFLQETAHRAVQEAKELNVETAK